MSDLIIEESAALAIGTIVSTTARHGLNPAGSIGVVYHSEADNGTFYASVLLTNGHDIGAFNQVEVETSLEILDQKPLDYAYQNPTQLQSDYATGVFRQIFAEYE